jgi:hypothetical protein
MVSCDLALSPLYVEAVLAALGRPAGFSAIPTWVTVLRSLLQSWLFPERFYLALERTPSVALFPNRFQPRSLE